MTIIFLILLAYWFDWRVLLQRNKFALKETMRLQQDLSVQQPNNVRVLTYKTQDQALKQQLKTVMQYCSEQEKSAVIIEKIQQLVQKDGLEVKQLKPLSDVNQNNFLVLSLQ